MVRRSTSSSSAALLVGLLAASGAMAQPAGAGRIECPSGVPTVASPASLPSGWRGTREGRSTRLIAMSVFSGPPEQMASLVPDSGSSRAPVWKLDPAATYWITCNYEGATIARQVPPAATVCKVRYESGRTKDYLARAYATCE